MQIALNLLSLVLVVCCLFLGLLILIQLPKKEAGLGQAFGAGATEALFGAGSGNTLTKLTKYSAGMFIGLCVLLAWMSAHTACNANRGVLNELNAATTPATPAGTGLIGSNAVAPVTKTITNVVIPVPAAVTNAPAAQTPTPLAPK
ncbi:MAG TPA: preprotein translocase subunit SecG [Verrucomicrobiota bacterium]|nr:preprotein translocase subunit SecG [Verrucomicrobiales bacterium]HRI14832.1 preprotein translocase subunit SecG [Verrucomicrobiota bacterium]